MPSLREVLEVHGPAVLLDAAATEVHAAWLCAGAPPRWARRSAEAGSGLFDALGELGVAIAQANAFIFCEGPGSILGIRTSAAAIRTWQVLRRRPAFSYRSLELIARTESRPGLTVIADARRQLWHALACDSDGRPGALQRLPVDQLTPPLAMPEGFRHWSPLPSAPVEPLPYDLPRRWARAVEADLLRPVAEPEAFLHEPPQYATWTPRVHQAPARPAPPAAPLR